jgi:hypothetical protein
MEPPTRATRNLSSRRRGNHGSVLYISRRPAMITDQFNTGDRRHRWMSASRSTGAVRRERHLRKRPATMLLTSCEGRCDTLEALLQVLCRGQCYVPGSFAWALAMSGVRQQSRVVRCDLGMLGDISWHKEPSSGSTAKRASASSR